MIGLVLAAGDRRALIAERKRDSGLLYSVTMPDGMGSDLPVEAPRMYLLRIFCSCSMANWPKTKY